MMKRGMKVGLFALPFYCLIKHLFNGFEWTLMYELLLVWCCSVIATTVLKIWGMPERKL